MITDDMLREAAKEALRRQTEALEREMPEDFHFDDEEVSEVKWVLFKEADEFRMKYCKPPLKKDNLTLVLLEEWFLQHGDLS